MGNPIRPIQRMPRNKKLKSFGVIGSREMWRRSHFINYDKLPIVVHWPLTAQTQVYGS